MCRRRMHSLHTMHSVSELRIMLRGLQSSEHRTKPRRGCMRLSLCHYLPPRRSVGGRVSELYLRGTSRNRARAATSPRSRAQTCPPLPRLAERPRLDLE
jgi:hypothetical protein